MSPQNRKKLNSLRKKLDTLDNELIKIIKKRTHLVKQVLSLKEFKNQIVDKKRVRRIWKAMIWSYVDFQRRNFKKK